MEVRQCQEPECELGEIAEQAAGDPAVKSPADPEFQQLGAVPPLHRTVQDEIRNYIIRNDLRPGQPLKPEAELARLFGVSRNSVREAVKALETTGVLETRRGSGVFVKDFSFAPLLDHLPYGLMRGPRALGELVALRRTLESAMIGDAMRALTPGSVARLRAVLAAMGERAARGEDIAEQDREFHRLLFADLGNEMLLRLFDLFWLAYHRAAPRAPRRDPVEIHRLHADLLDAVVSGERKRARWAVEQHYVGIAARVGEGAR